MKRFLQWRVSRNKAGSEVEKESESMRRLSNKDASRVKAELNKGPETDRQTETSVLDDKSSRILTWKEEKVVDAVYALSSCGSPT